MNILIKKNSQSENYIKSLKPTAQVKAFALELLEDYQEHSRKEIIDYANERATELGLDEYSRGCINGGVQDLLQLKNCKKISSGIYQLIEPEEKEEVTPLEKAIFVCEDAAQKIQSISRKIDYITASDVELEYLQKLKTINIELNKIIDNAKN